MGRSDPDYYIYCLKHCIFGQFRQLVCLNTLRIDIRQLAGSRIVYVVVRGNIGVVKNPGRIDDHLTQKSPGSEQPQRVVDRGL